MSSAHTEGEAPGGEICNFTTLINTHPEIIFHIVDQADTTGENVSAHMVLLAKLRSTCRLANKWGTGVLGNGELFCPEWMVRYNKMMLAHTDNKMRPLNIRMNHKELMLKAYSMLKNMYTCEWVFGIVLHFMKTRCEWVFEEADSEFAFVHEDSFEFISYIYAGMRCHKSHRQIQLDGFNILKQLVRVSRDQSIMAFQGLILTCVDAVNAHRKDVDIVKAALEALASVFSIANNDCEENLTTCSLATFNSATHAISKMIAVFMKQDLVIAPGTRTTNKERYFSTLSTASSLLIYFWRYGTSEYYTGRAWKRSVRRVGRLLYTYRQTRTFYDFFKNISPVYERLNDLAQPAASDTVLLLYTSNITPCCAQAFAECIDTQLDYAAITFISHMVRIGYPNIHDRPMESLVQLAIGKAADRLQMDMYSEPFMQNQLDFAKAVNTLVVEGVPGEFQARQALCTTRAMTTLIVSLLSRYGTQCITNAVSSQEDVILNQWIVLLSSILKTNAQEQVKFVVMGGVQMCLKFFKRTGSYDFPARLHLTLVMLMCTVVTNNYDIIGRGKIHNATTDVAMIVMFTLQQMTEITAPYGLSVLSLLQLLIEDNQLSLENSIESIDLAQRMLGEIGDGDPSEEAGIVQYNILNFLATFVENDPNYKRVRLDMYKGFVFPSNNNIVLRNDYKRMLVTVKSHMQL